MWQEERGKPFYRFQTCNRKAMAKMKRREKFNLTGSGYNCELWIFVSEFSRPDIAKKALEALAGSKVEFDFGGEVFYSRVFESDEQNEAA